MMALQVVQMIKQAQTELGVDVREIVQQIVLNHEQWQESTLMQLYNGKSVIYFDQLQ